MAVNMGTVASGGWGALGHCNTIVASTRSARQVHRLSLASRFGWRAPVCGWLDELDAGDGLEGLGESMFAGEMRELVLPSSQRAARICFPSTCSSSAPQVPLVHRLGCLSLQPTTTHYTTGPTPAAHAQSQQPYLIYALPVCFQHHRRANSQLVKQR